MRDIIVWQKIQFEENITATNLNIPNNTVTRYTKLLKI